MVMNASTKRRIARRRRNAAAALREFLRDEALGGIALLIATVVAVIWANVGGGESYASFWHTTVEVGAGSWAVSEDLQHWVNDGLMTLFFFTVGLEIKRELVVGELRSRSAAILPAIAAAGGVLLPIVLFVAIVGSGPARSGWGIPMATDIAFAVGILALLGPRSSSGAKLFLLAVAIVDDILAVIVIAVFYSNGIQWLWLLAALAGLGAIGLLKRLRVPYVLAYVPIGVAVWIATLESGVHATIAGVALGLITPVRPVRGRDVLGDLEHVLHPISAFVVVPIFALANAGVYFGGGLIGHSLSTRLTWAVAAGLVLGKLVGIGGATHLVRRAGWGRLPGDMRPREVWGIAALGGVGFTVSLFVTDLAFSDPSLTGPAKVGLFVGTGVSVLLALALLLVARRGEGSPFQRGAPSAFQRGARSPFQRRDGPLP